MFSSVKPGDVVHYTTPQGQYGKGKAVLTYDTHVVVNRGKGQPQVVNDKNYVKHVRGGKVIGAVLSKVAAHDKYLKGVAATKAFGWTKTNEDRKDAEAASSRVSKTKHAAKNKKKKVLKEVAKSTLINYVNKARADRKKQQIRSRNAWLVHDPDNLGGDDGERAEWEHNRAERKKSNRSKGIKQAVKRIAGNLPAEKVTEGTRSEYDANIKMSQGAKPTQKGHYLMRDGRKLSGPHSPEEAVKQYKGMGDSKGVKIVHVKEGVEIDVTSFLMEAYTSLAADIHKKALPKVRKALDRMDARRAKEPSALDYAADNAKAKAWNPETKRYSKMAEAEENKYDKAAQKAIKLARKNAKGNKHVDTEPKLNLPEKGTGGPMEGSESGERNDRIP